MVSRANQKSAIIEAICENTGDVFSGEVFHSVKLLESNYSMALDYIKGQKIICCGNIDNEERVFRTEDGRYYFSLCGGWGGYEGVLYGISLRLFHDFGHSTTFKTALEECDIQPNYHSFGGAMAYNRKKYTLGQFKPVIQNLIDTNSASASEL